MIRSRIGVARLYLTALLLISLLGCGDQPQLTPLYANDTIVAFGDSLTYGTGADAGKSYPDNLQAKLNLNVVNAGVPGDTTADGVRRINDVLDEHQPQLVILCLGGNDFLRKRSKREVVDNLTTIIERVRASNAEVMLVAVPELGLFLSDADLYRDIADQLHTPLLEDVLSDLLSDNSLKSDAIHLNNQGYALFADEIHQFLIERGAVAY